MLQLMIDASDGTTGSSETGSASTSGCPMHQASNGTTRHRLTAKEIVDNSVTFLVAGYETTANTLSYTTYLLAINPDIQKKLQSEIDSYFDQKPVSLGRDHTSKLIWNFGNGCIVSCLDLWFSMSLPLIGSICLFIGSVVRGSRNYVWSLEVLIQLL